MSMRRGFSLVELSIVLVILGLLTGGILAGRSLVRASEVRSVTVEYQRYATAVHAFRDKYFMLPGDITNATSFWGAQDATHSNCIALLTASTGPLTCNGDGNGRIADWALETASTGYEMWRAWQHLANAGLIEGSYSGVRAATNNSPYDAAIGVNGPGSKLGKAGWNLAWLGPYPGDSGWFAGNYGNAFYFGTEHPAKITNGGALEADEAWNIDTKLDDGLPHLGRVVANKNGPFPECVAASNTAYNLTSTVTTGCPLNFIPGF